MVATKKAAAPDATNTNVLMTRPSANPDGSFTVTWRRNNSKKEAAAMYGWCAPASSATDYIYRNEGGCFFYSKDRNILPAMVPVVAPDLIDGPIPMVVTMRYCPKAGLVHVRFDQGAEVLIASGLANDLVPAVMLLSAGESCEIVP